jgi:hypothetical protein
VSTTAFHIFSRDMSATELHTLSRGGSGRASDTVSENYMQSDGMREESDN